MNDTNNAPAANGEGLPDAPTRDPTIKHVRMINPHGQVTDISVAEASAILGGALMRPGRVVMRQEGETQIIEDQSGRTLLTPVWDTANGA